MFAPFEELNENSRLWIYQANRPFTKNEGEAIEATLHAFCDDWAAHGHPLKTSFRVEYNQFIILAADESYHLPSGCSIDSSVRVIKEIQQHTQIDFFDRAQVAFLIDKQVGLFPLSKLKDEFTNGTLNDESITFNNLVATKAEWTKGWIAPARTTWLARYLPKAAAAN